MKGYLYKVMSNGEFNFYLLSKTPFLQEGSTLSQCEYFRGTYYTYSDSQDVYSLSGVSNVNNTSGNCRVDYNKIEMTPDRARKLGNYVKVSLQADGQEIYSSTYNHYEQPWVMRVEFGPTFDNSANSALILEGHVKFSDGTAAKMFRFADDGFRDDTGYGGLAGSSDNGVTGGYFYSETSGEFADYYATISFVTDYYYFYKSGNQWRVGYRGMQW